jgi:hypothetical protein
VFCAAYVCDSRYKKGCALSFFRFPSANIKQPAMFTTSSYSSRFGRSLWAAQNPAYSLDGNFVRMVLIAHADKTDFIVKNDPYPEDKSLIHNVSVCPLNVFKKYL